MACTSRLALQHARVETGIIAAVVTALGPKRDACCRAKKLWATSILQDKGTSRHGYRLMLLWVAGQARKHRGATAGESDAYGLLPRVDQGP